MLQSDNRGNPRDRATLQVKGFKILIQGADRSKASMPRSKACNFALSYDNYSWFTITNTKYLLDGGPAPFIYTADVSKHDGVSLCPARRQRRKALIFNCCFRLLFKIGCNWERLECNGFLQNVGVFDLSDTIDPDLLRSCAESQWVAIPNYNICGWWVNTRGPVDLTILSPASYPVQNIGRSIS